jgi:MerR family transcriptional regulator, light-induced transcriptional regulator
MAAPAELIATELASLAEVYLEAQLAGNRRDALKVIEDAVKQGIPPLDIQLDVIQQAQREIGRLWQQDRISIAQEHMATAISQIALAHVYQSAKPAKPNGKKVVVACVNGELHDFPARLVADALDLAGYDTRFLGADVPNKSLLSSIDRERPDLVALSVTMTFNMPALRAAIEEVRRATGAALPIIVGGNACADKAHLAAEVGADAYGCDARELVIAANNIFGWTK